jgi:hypothetical protein
MLRALLRKNPSPDDVTKLLARGPEFKEAVSTVRPGRDLPLRIAIQFHNTAVAEVLHNKGADFNDVDHLGPLLLKVLLDKRPGSLSMVKWMLSFNGVNPDPCGYDTNRCHERREEKLAWPRSQPFSIER